MIEFKKVELRDKEWMDPLIARGNMRACHQNFTNIFAWAEAYDYRVGRVEEFLVVKGRPTGNSPYYFFPGGSGEIKTVLRAMIQDAQDCGHKFLLAGVSPENKGVLETFYPEGFEYVAMRDSFDYIYLLSKLVSLSGNKLHSKRNHINHFKKNHNWSIEEISRDNLGEVWEMNLEWCARNACTDDYDLAQESCAVRRCFENFGQLGLEGALLRWENKIIAYTMGEKLNSDTYVIHIEKAFGEIQGAYQVINREFAEKIQARYPELVYVNREDDMGNEGLRKAKLSYKPEWLEEKYWAKRL